MKQGLTFSAFKIALANQIRKIAVQDKDVYLHLHCIASSSYSDFCNYSGEIPAIHCGYIFSKNASAIFYCEILNDDIQFIREADLSELYLQYTTKYHYFSKIDLQARQLISKDTLCEIDMVRLLK